MGGADFPRLVIAGTQSGVGKTTVCMGLLAALHKRVKVQPYKVGPDYIDSAYHTFITGRKSRNLDSWMLDHKTLTYLFKKNMQEAGLAVIEGVMGLFDGAETGHDEGSTAHVAKIIKAPVILVVDGSGMAASGAAMVKGYKDFDPDVDLAGVIFNRLSGETHYKLLKEAVETYTGVRVYGYLPEETGVLLPSRHLGLVPSAEIAGLREKIARLAVLTETTVEVDALLRLAKEWHQLPDSTLSLTADVSVGSTSPDRVKIAVADDRAFNFYYWDSLELLEELGAEIVFFSPLEDRKLPDGVNGLILGGGFPEVFAGELQDNRGMKKSIREALTSGLPYYAECGGLMYLVETLVDFDGKKYEMVGWLKGSCRMTPQLQRFGYANLELKEDCVFGPRGSAIRVHEFHRSLVEDGEGRTAYRLYRSMKQGAACGEWECGYIKGSGVAGYPHLHLYGNIDFARNFLSHARRYKERGHTR